MWLDLLPEVDVILYQLIRYNKSYMKHYTALSLTCLGLLAATNTHAQQANQQKDDQHIERLTVTSNPLKTKLLESATPVSVLADEALQEQQSASLGDTLKNLPGVHSSYYGPVAGSPVIRGLDGPRVKVLQNGLDSADVSRNGPDHAVSADASIAQRIEVLRGPATLLYGSGAIGGVVNVIDNALPTNPVDGVQGVAGYQYQSVSEQHSVSTNLDAGSDQFAWHLNAFSRDSKDLSVSDDAPNSEFVDGGKLLNSAADSTGFTLGSGWLADDFTLAFGYSQLDNQYGIPAHSHHHHEDGHTHEETHAHEHEEEAEPQVLADLKQRRYQAMFDWNKPLGVFERFHWHTAYNDFAQKELEGGAIGTEFTRETLESRLWAEHQPLAGWRGVVGLHLNQQDYAANGEEAFTPHSEQQSLALFVLEERRYDNWLWQVGGRFEHLSIDPDSPIHKEEHDEYHEHEHEHHEEQLSLSKVSYDAFSASVGTVYSLSKDSSLAFNFSHSQRAPSATEVFANGLHLATNTYEVGAAYMLETEHQEHEEEEHEGHAEHEEHQEGHFDVVLGSGEVKKETANNLDVTYRLASEGLSVDVSVFYNQVGNFLYQADTGLFFDAHAHEDEHKEQDAHGEEKHAAEHDHHEHQEEGLAVFHYQQQDARLYGLEASVDWHINEAFRLTAYGDYIRAKFTEGGNVPRIPPLRLGWQLHWEKNGWHLEVGANHYATQDDIAKSESKTDGYTLYSAAVNYYLSLSEADVTFFLKGNNLTDEYAQVHNSWLKEQVPIAGRDVRLGIRVAF